ncbi:peptide deformylase [Salibacteraceae bacterium]|jgi:peptide deformylase|nr:peptide deformylase [Salibacteraceae bacterium]
MILPIIAYGDPVLKREGDEIDKDYPELQKFIADMFETMYNANGVGLAAPQVGRSIRLFIIDTTPFTERDDDEDPMDEEEFNQLSGLKKVFINPIIVEEDGDKWPFNEGCLSIPGINEDVTRKRNLIIEYFDENFNLVEEEYTGKAARVIQHEYDHIDGILFTDRLNPLRKQILKKRLNEISRGITNARYKMKFPNR